MLKVNTQDYSVTRVDLPQELRGLSQHTLSNLQTELKPVPAHLVNIEFWQEVDASIMPNETQVFDGTETLTADPKTKTVTVVRGLRDKTAEELEAERKASIPQSISPRQARLQLLKTGLLDELESVVSANREWRISWEYATEVNRNSPLIDAVATQANLTPEQIDQMFIEASKL
jgi:hypothetical protein